MQNKYTPQMIRENIERLPLIDASAFEILSLLNNPHSNYDHIIPKISPDVTALFLNMANKAHYGKVVRSVNHAMTILGYKAMRQILVTSFLLDHFIKHLGLTSFSLDRFQKQSHFCAAISAMLAKSLVYKQTEDLFTVSMLYNIGKLIIVVYFSKVHQEIVALKQSKKISTSEAERQVLGVTHAEIGAIALERFNIPKDICEAVRYHNQTNRIRPLDDNFQLEAITREAAMIVHNFLLPDENELRKLTKQLSGDITGLRAEFQRAIGADTNTGDFNRIFLSGLNQAGNLIIGRLKTIWQERQENR